MPSEGDDHRLFLGGQDRRSRLLRTCRVIANRPALFPLGDGLLIDPVPLVQSPQARLTMLYRSTDRLCRSGAPMKSLSHSASFESLDKNAPPKDGTKHLASLASNLRPRSSALGNRLGLRGIDLGDARPIQEKQRSWTPMTSMRPVLTFWARQPSQVDAVRTRLTLIGTEIPRQHSSSRYRAVQRCVCGACRKWRRGAQRAARTRPAGGANRGSSFGKRAVEATRVTARLGCVGRMRGRVLQSDARRYSAVAGTQLCS
jgi:hypothetical protein